MFIVSILIGLVLVISSLFMIKREINKATYNRNKLIDETELYDREDLLKILEDMQLSLNQMNEAFYDIANDLEGKYSVHDKEIADIQSKLDVLRSKNQLTKRSREGKINSGVAKHQSHMNQIQEKKDDNDEESGVLYEAHHQKVYENTQASALSEEVGKGTDHLSYHKRESQDDIDVRSKVIALRSQGYTLPEIAKKLGMGIGELQLMLNIKK